MVSDACAAAVKKAFGGGEVPDKVGKQMKRRIESLVRKHTLQDSPNVVESVLKELEQDAKSLEIANVVRKRNAALNARKIIEGVGYIRSVWGDKPIDGFRAVLRSSPIDRTGAGNSVLRGQASRSDDLIGSLYTRLAEKNLFKLFISGKFDTDIHRAMKQLDSKNKDFGDIHPHAIEMAKDIGRTMEYARQQFNIHGGAIGRLDGYVTARATDSAQVSSKPDLWLSRMEEDLDFTKTFADVDPELRSQKLKELRTEFMSDVHISFDKPVSTSTGLTGFGNIGKSLSHSRVLHFKTPELEARYSREFGSGNLSKNVMFSLTRLGSDTALMEHLGPNAKSNLDSMFDLIQKDLKKSNDSVTARKLDTFKMRMDRDLWPHIDGTSNAIESHIIAKVSGWGVAIQQTSSLGGAVLSMPPDLAIVGAASAYQGRSFIGGMASGLKTLIAGLPSNQVADVVRGLTILNDGIKGSMVERFSSGDLPAGKVAAGVQKFFKWTGIQFWPDRLRDGFVAATSNWVAVNTRHNFKSLPMEVSRMLRVSGFDENTWDNVLRQATLKADDGNIYFTPEAFVDIPDLAFETVLKNTGAKPTPARVAALRGELKQKIGSMFQNEAINAVVEGDAQTAARLVGGDPKGSVMRVIRSQVTMFKTFPVAVLEKPVARLLKGSADGAGNLNTSGLFGLAKMFGWMTALGYGSMVLKDLAKGVEPRDPANPDTWMAAFLQGGGAGIYGDFLFGETNRSSGGILSTLAGPIGGDIQRLHDLWTRAKAGDDTAGQALKFVISNTPGSNVFYTKWALDYFIVSNWYESLNPGYLKRAEDRLMKNNEQQYFLPPSQK